MDTAGRLPNRRLADNDPQAIFPRMTPAPPGSAVVETPIGVRMPELDSFGHVNHAVFLNYLEHARFDALRQAGFSWEVLADRNWAIFVVRVEIDYLSEARREDELIVRTWADSFRRTSMIFAQEIVRADNPAVAVAKARVTAVWIGPDRKPMRAPDEIRKRLADA